MALDLGPTLLVAHNKPLALNTAPEGQAAGYEPAKRRQGNSDSCSFEPLILLLLFLQASEHNVIPHHSRKRSTNLVRSELARKLP